MKEEINLNIFLIFDFNIIKATISRNIPKEDLVNSIFSVFKAKSSLYIPIHTIDAVSNYNALLRNDLYACLCTPMAVRKGYKKVIEAYELAIRMIYHTIINDEKYNTNTAYLNLHHRILNYKEN